MDCDAKLSAALEAALVRELRATWRQINESLFKGALSAPTLELVSARSTLGRWVPRTRTIEISRFLVVEWPWGAVIEVLKHEAAHQYVCELLGETEETAHGPAFREACARLGIDPRASGVPVAPEGEPDGTSPLGGAWSRLDGTSPLGGAWSRLDGTSPLGGAWSRLEDKIVERIARLLALAESPNRHEAEAAMAAAQRLMLKHNLDAARAAAVHAYGFSQLGDPTGRVTEHQRLVAMILGKHFFVEAIWVPVYRPLEGKRGSLLEICGTRANLAIADYVHGFLHQTAERLWREHRTTRGIASNRDRRAYLAGVMTGFADTLARQDVKSRTEGLVWVGDGNLARYFRRRHPHVRHVRHTGQRRTDAWTHGREAGRKIVLHRPVPSPATAGGRLLKG